MSSNDSEMPSAVLRAEHQVILRVIQVLQYLVQRSKDGPVFDREALGLCVEFFRLFADACHHAKEEDLLFPALESRGIPREGGPIGVMLHEHQLARGYTRQMGEALEAFDRGDASAVKRFQGVAEQYVDLLSNHIFKEDNVLFTMGDRVLTNGDQDRLCSQFCEAGCRAFGGKGRDELEEIANALGARFPEA